MQEDGEEHCETLPSGHNTQELATAVVTCPQGPKCQPKSQPSWDDITLRPCAFMRSLLAAESCLGRENDSTWGHVTGGVPRL